MSNSQRVYAATDAYVLLPLLGALLRSLKAVSAGGAGCVGVGDKGSDGGATCVGTATLDETMVALPSLLESDATITDGTAAASGAASGAASVGGARDLLAFEGIRRWIRPLSVSMVPAATSTLAAGTGPGAGTGGGKDDGNGNGKGGGCKSGGKSGGGGNVLEAMQAMGRSDVAAALRDLGLGRSADRIHQSSKGMGGMNGVGGLRVRSGGETGGDGGGDGGGGGDGDGDGDGDGGDDYGGKGGDEGGTKGIMVKTLCLIARESEVVLCVLRLDRRLQVSKCASAMGVRRCDIRMAREEELVTQCGYRRGSIGPVGSRNTATVLVRRRERTERPERERRRDREREISPTVSYRACV